ncbi:MAG: hypothetical protein WCO71_06360, partial [Pseudomonadota bacterium]
YLDLPLGQDVSLITASEHLSEATKILVATGRFKDNMQLKLERSFKTQHYIIKATLEDISSTYLGVGAGYAKLKRNNRSGQLDDFGASIYWGNRDLDHSGWGLDLDLKMNETTNRWSGSVSEGDYSSYTKSKSKISDAQSTITTMNQNLFGGLVYTGFLLKTAFERFSWNYSSHTKYENDLYDDTVLHQSDYVQLAAEPFSGIKLGKASIGVGVSRSVSRNLKSGGNETHYKNGQPNNDDAPMFYAPDGYRFVTGARISASYSDKPRLNIVEPGVDINAIWQRSFATNYDARPHVSVNGQYTRFARPNLAFTLLQASYWDYQNRDWGRSVRRQHEVGFHVDFITDSQFVTYGEFTRFGGLKREILYDDQADGLTLSNHAEVGLIRATSDMLYSFSFVYLNYRPSADRETTTSFKRNSGLDRLGGH